MLKQELVGLASQHGKGGSCRVLAQPKRKFSFAKRKATGGVTAPPAAALEGTDPPQEPWVAVASSVHTIAPDR